MERKIFRYYWTHHPFPTNLWPHWEEHRQKKHSPISKKSLIWKYQNCYNSLTLAINFGRMRGPTIYQHLSPIISQFLDQSLTGVCFLYVLSSIAERLAKWNTRWRLLYHNPYMKVLTVRDIPYIYFTYIAPVHVLKFCTDLKHWS